MRTTSCPSRSPASTGWARSASAASKSQPCASASIRAKAANRWACSWIRSARPSPATRSMRPRARSTGPLVTSTIYANDQLTSTPSHLEQPGRRLRQRRADPGQGRRRRGVEDVENNQIGAWAFPGKANTDKSLTGGRAILLIVFKQPGANVIQTVDSIKDGPAGVAGQYSARHRRARDPADRTQTIRASVQGCGDHPV